MWWSLITICPAQRCPTPHHRQPQSAWLRVPEQSDRWCCGHVFTSCWHWAKLRERGAFTTDTQPDLNRLLDLVALGTVADVVPLDAVNRRLVEAGLRRMREAKACAGINALFAAARRDVTKATAYDLGFMLGPRVNAAGDWTTFHWVSNARSLDDPARADCWLTWIAYPTASARA